MYQRSKSIESFCLAAPPSAMPWPTPYSIAKYLVWASGYLVSSTCRPATGIPISPPNVQTAAVLLKICKRAEQHTTIDISSEACRFAADQQLLACKQCLPQQKNNWIAKIVICALGIVPFKQQTLLSKKQCKTLSFTLHESASATRTML